MGEEQSRGRCLVLLVEVGAESALTRDAPYKYREVLTAFTWRTRQDKTSYSFLPGLPSMTSKEPMEGP
jgi:hypothetical protein